ncbi:MAG: PilZ domain-containing protein [Burkholderiales bacterium]
MLTGGEASTRPNRAMRQFIRHPTEIPIQIRRERRRAAAAPPLRNVSLGGLAFQSQTVLEPGSVVLLRIPSVRPQFSTRARVVWCSEADGAFEVGVEFLDVEDAYRGRLVEQVCHIEQYRREVLKSEGRQLTSEEAAAEWIARFASEFPGTGPEDRK